MFAELVVGGVLTVVAPAHAGFQTLQPHHATLGGQGLPSAPSFAQPEPCSPSAMATPVLFGGPRVPQHTWEPSHGDANMWDGGDHPDAGAALFSNLSVACCTSPTGHSLLLEAKHPVWRLPQGNRKTPSLRTRIYTGVKQSYASTCPSAVAESKFVTRHVCLHLG
jgi:hypothetical protein